MVWYRKIGRFIGFVILAIVILLGGLLVHELGHGITAQLLGGQFKSLYVFPGVEVWPEPGQRYDGEWGLNVGGAAIEPGSTWADWHHGLMLLMGSGTTFLASVASLAALWLFRPRGWPASVLIAGALLYLDILFYTILPEWFALPHWIFFGGTTPEPLIGAELLGCSRGIFIALILIFSSLLSIGVAGYFIRLWKAGKEGESGMAA